MNWETTRLDELITFIWQSLEAGAREISHPFRFAALATADDLEPSLRTVVLRGTDAAARQLTCHTDARSAKVRELRRNDRVQWLFHDPTARVQIRAGGATILHCGNAIAREAWCSTPLASRVNYCTAWAPGTPLGGPDEALPESWRGSGPTIEETERGAANFAVAATTVEHVEWLLLRAEGQRRAGFVWAQGRFVGNWLVP